MTRERAHSHCHHHSDFKVNRSFSIAIIANSLFVAAQIIFALLANSSSLLADAVHNLGDVLGLIFSWIGAKLLTKEPNETSTYGMKKTSILTALINGILLVFSCGIIASEAVYKLFFPNYIQAISVIIIASIGIIVNGCTALLFLKGKEDINIRAAYLHLLYDAFISFGVVLGGIALYWTNWLWIDPVLALAIALIILKGTWGLFMQSFRLIIDAVPHEISWSSVLELFKAQNGVVQVHDLHIWALSTKENALSVHLYMPDFQLSDEDRSLLVLCLRDKYHIHHATIQIEKDLNFCNDSCFESLSPLEGRGNH